MADITDIPHAATNGSGEEIDEGEYTEEEIEISEGNDSAEEETAKIPNKSPSEDIKMHKASSGSQAAPGKVRPSEQVRKAPMESPDTLRNKAQTKFVGDKNPFPSNGLWNTSTLSQIEICFPVLTGKNETTNELTRSTRPEARYWKAPIAFKFANFTSETLRFDNVHIPFHTGKGYGDSFVYMALSSDAGSAFAEAGKKNAPTKVTENSLMPDKERWWKIANKIEGLFGVIASNKRFQSKSLSTIFDSTQSGISASVILRFYCKAATDEKNALRPTTARTISVEVVRGYITGTDINVQLPTRVNRQRVKVEPTAVPRDIASDALMERLGQLGL